MSWHANIMIIVIIFIVNTIFNVSQVYVERGISPIVAGCAVVEILRLMACPHCRKKVRLSHKLRLSQKSATVAIVSPFSATVSLLWDSLSFLRQCGQGLSLKRLKCIRVASSRSLHHVTLSVTWSFNSLYRISYRCSTGTMTPIDCTFMSRNPLEIKVQIETFHGHLMLSLIWPLTGTMWLKPTVSVLLTPARYLELFSGDTASNIGPISQSRLLPVSIRPNQYLACQVNTSGNERRNRVT